MPTSVDRSSPSPTEVDVQVGTRDRTTALVYPVGDPARRVTRLILAHGAGAGQRSPFMVAFARALSAEGIEVVTFDFLYMARRRRLPDRTPVLEAVYRAVMDRWESGDVQLFIGGKSMGGRIATQVAAADPERPLAGLVLLGYPLHPPGRPATRRDAHLPAVGRPMLFVQGSRDAFGTPAELRPVVRSLSPPATLHVIEGGDHSFRRSTKDPDAQAAALVEAQETVIEWIRVGRARGRKNTAAF
jgi:predicted alpha/beta-hydrolase family hydrolase